MAIAVHLDTDLGSDMDDLAALAMLLGMPEVEIVGITTCADPGGQRAALVEHALELAGRGGIPVASGAFEALGGARLRAQIQDERYWPEVRVSREPRGTPGEAIDLLARNAAEGAAVIAVGPYTNLAILETLRPGAFAATNVVVMGGFTGRLGPGLPSWNAARDYNVQADRVAARIVFERLDPLIVPLDASVLAWLREADLPELRSGGPLAQLVAVQAELYGRDQGVTLLAASNEALPPDLLNFQHDPLACAAALGWDCVEVAEIPLALDEDDGSLYFRFEDGAPIRRVVTSVDGERFAAQWMAAATQV